MNRKTTLTKRSLPIHPCLTLAAGIYRAFLFPPTFQDRTEVSSLSKLVNTNFRRALRTNSEQITGLFLGVGLEVVTPGR